MSENKEVAMILTTRDHYREQMVTEILSFPSCKKPNIKEKGSVVLLYNSSNNEFYAEAKLANIVKLCSDDKDILLLKYPKAYDVNWKYNILLDDFKLINNKFCREELNSISLKVSKPYGYTLNKKGNIMYIDEYDLKMLEKLYGINN